MIKSDWIVGARLNYERGTPFPRYIASFSTTTRRTWPRAHGTREQRREVLIHVNAPLLVA